MANIEQIFLLLISGQGLLISIALLTSVLKKNYSNFFLGIITFVITIELLSVLAIQLGYNSSETAIPFWLLGSYLLIPPSLFLFERLNIKTDFNLKAKHVLLFIPAFIEIITEIIYFYINKSLDLKYSLIENTIWFLFTEVLPVILMLLVVGIYLIDLINTSKQLRQNNLKKQFANLIKLQSFWVAFALLTVLWFIQSVLQIQVFAIIEIVLLIGVFILGYLGLFQPSFFEIPKPVKVKIEKSKFNHYDDNKELKRLTILFDDDKIYLKPRLSLNDLSRELNLPKRYVSLLINLNYSTNFNSFVNSYRVKEFLERIEDPKERHKTLLALALDSGFNSKSSFNQIVKSVTGKNPKDFLDR